MQVEKLSVNGPALAALLQECVLLRNPFDGILIGIQSSPLPDIVELAVSVEGKLYYLYRGPRGE